MQRSILALASDQYRLTVMRACNSCRLGADRRREIGEHVLERSDPGLDLCRGEAAEAESETLAGVGRDTETPDRRQGQAALSGTLGDHLGIQTMCEIGHGVHACSRR